MPVVRLMALSTRCPRLSFHSIYADRNALTADRKNCTELSVSTVAMDQRLVLAVLVLGCFAVNIHAEVCFWKQGFGCCGTDCGVFCGNCASCDDQQCGVQGDRKAELEKNRQAFFVSIAAGKDIPIDLLKKHVKEAKTLPGNKVDNTKQGVITFEDAFKMIDPDSDGDIGRGEFDRDKLYDNNLKLKLTDFINPDAQNPANTVTAKPANTDTGKTANTDTVKPVNTDNTNTGKTTTDTTQPTTANTDSAAELDLLRRQVDILSSELGARIAASDGDEDDTRRRLARFG